MGHFFKIPDAVFFDKRLTEQAKTLYALLDDLADVSAKNGYDYIFPKENTLAEKLSVSRKTITRTLKLLEETGHIDIERQAGKNSKIYLTRDKIVPTTKDNNVPTVGTKKSRPFNRVNTTNQFNVSQNKKHVPSYDSELYKQSVRNGEVIYKKSG